MNTTLIERTGTGKQLKLNVVNKNSEREACHATVSKRF